MPAVADPNVFGACFLAGAAASGNFRKSTLFNETGGTMKEAWDIQQQFVAWVNEKAAAEIEAKRKREADLIAKEAKIKEDDAKAAAAQKAEREARFGQKQTVPA